MPKQIKFSEDARDSFKKGSETLTKAVRVTFGPKGHNVAVEQKYGAPLSTHDGATVAREVELEEPFTNMGASLVREAAKKTAEDVGDGTTTATVLTQAMVREGFRNISAGAEALSLKRGIEKATAAVVKELVRVSKPVSSKAQMTRIATLAGHDAEIGEIIGDVMDKVGKNGVVTVEEGKGIKTETEIVEGMKFDRGYISPHFVTDTARMRAEITDAYIFLTDKKLSAVTDVIPMLEKVARETKNIVIIADDVEGEALAVMALNRLKGNLNVLAVKAPGFGDRRKAMLDDIAVLTGGQVVAEERGRRLDKVTLEDFGRARLVIADKDNTTIVDGKGSQKEIAERVRQIRAQIEETTSDYDREKLQERLAHLAGGVAIIKVGAPTETELKERKSRVEGALAATRAAVEEGVLPGGGVALVNAQLVIPGLKLKGDEAVGAATVSRALEEPLRQIVNNAGFEGSVVVGRVKKSEPGFGFDVEKGEYGDMEDRGILDPLKVIRTALQNAASVAALALITEGMVTDIPEKKKPAAPPMPQY